MSSRTRMLGAGRAGSTSYGSNVNMIQFGDRLQGLAPQATHFFISGNGKAGWNQYQTQTYAPKRNFVFCLNQLGGIGRGKSQFKVDGLNNPDGSKVCKPYEYKSLDKKDSTSNNNITDNTNRLLLEKNSSETNSDKKEIGDSELETETYSSKRDLSISYLTDVSLSCNYLVFGKNSPIDSDKVLTTEDEAKAEGATGLDGYPFIFRGYSNYSEPLLNQENYADYVDGYNNQCENFSELLESNNNLGPITMDDLIPPSDVSTEMNLELSLTYTTVNLHTDPSDSTDWDNRKVGGVEIQYDESNPTYPYKFFIYFKQQTDAEDFWKTVGDDVSINNSITFKLTPKEIENQSPSVPEEEVP